MAITLSDSFSTWYSDMIFCQMCINLTITYLQRKKADIVGKRTSKNQILTIKYLLLSQNGMFSR